MADCRILEGQCRRRLKDHNLENCLSDRTLQYNSVTNYSKNSSPSMYHRKVQANALKYSVI